MYKSLADIPQNEIIKVEMAQDAISLEGRQEVINLLEAHRIRIQDSWEWDWVINKGNYKGTLPKRISHYAHVEYGVDLSPAILTTIGTLARSHSSLRKEYYVDLTQNIDWDNGDFGDYGSCFWGGRPHALQILHDNHAFALRYWRPITSFSKAEIEAAHNSNNHCEHSRGELCRRCRSLTVWSLGRRHENHMIGMGRTWLGERDGNILLWNTYGEFQTITSARILATMFGLSYKLIELDNGERDDGELWINSGNGYVVGAPDKIDNLERVDLNWRRLIIMLCESCHQREHHFNEFTRVNDSPYCPACLAPKKCPICKKEEQKFLLRRIETARATRRYIRICGNCFELMERCLGCAHMFHPKYMKRLTAYGEPSHLVCKTCFDEYPTCPTCQKTTFSLRDGECHACFYSMKGDPNGKKETQQARAEAIAD